MEAVAIVSLAGNTLQFINLVGTPTSKSNTLYSSASRTLQEQVDQEILTSHIELLTAKVRQSVGNTDTVLEELWS